MAADPTPERCRCGLRPATPEEWRDVEECEEPASGPVCWSDSNCSDRYKERIDHALRVLEAVEARMAEIEPMANQETWRSTGVSYEGHLLYRAEWDALDELIPTDARGEKP